MARNNTQKIGDFMLKVLLFKLWPAMIPIALYLLYRLIRPARDEAVIDAKRTEHWPYVLLLSLIIGAFILFYTGLTQENHGNSYTPTHMEDGKLIKERLSE